MKSGMGRSKGIDECLANIWPSSVFKKKKKTEQKEDIVREPLVQSGYTALYIDPV